jgi:hypothetical protein
MTRRKRSFSLGKIAKLWPFLVELLEKEPDSFSGPDHLRARVARVWPALLDGTRCPNCSASMATYRRKVDYFVVMLLVSMGRIVRENMERLPFSDANAVHVNADERIPHEARTMTGIASALGLIAPLAEPGRWAITSRGFAALRGEPVPAEVVTFRDRVIERPEGTVTLSEAVAARRAGDQGVYDPNEWVHIEAFHEPIVL